MLLHPPSFRPLTNSRLQCSHRATSSTSIAKHLNLRLNDGGSPWYDFVVTALVNAREISVVGILDLQDLCSFVDMVDTTEERVHLLECNATGLWNDEDDEDGKEDVNTSEEEEGIAAFC